MNKQILLPYEIIDEILQYLNVCEACNKYKLNKHVHTCAICNKNWCIKCNNNKHFVRLAYFEIYIIICRKCYADARTSRFINNLTQ